MSKTIGELTAASVPVPDDSLLEVEVSGVSKQMSIADLLSITGTVEQGSNSNGNYIRFSSGIQICWASSDVEVTTSSAVGSIYASPIFVLTYPKAFSSLPIVTTSLVDGTITTIWSGYPASAAVTGHSGRLVGTISTGKGKPSYIAIGEWA